MKIETTISKQKAWIKVSGISAMHRPLIADFISGIDGLNVTQCSTPAKKELPCTFHVDILSQKTFLEQQDKIECFVESMNHHDS